MTWRRVVAGAALAAMAWASGVGLAAAAFNDSGKASHTVATATLAPPSNLAASHGTCLVAVSAAIKLTWTASTSTWSDGYQILRSTTSGGPYTVVATVAGAATTTYTDSTVAFSTTYYYRLRTHDGPFWQSAPTAQVSLRTPGTLCII